MEATTTVKTKTFGTFEILPLTVERQSQAAANLAAEGTKITANSGAEHTTLHAVEMARLCIHNWTKDGVEPLRKLSVAAVRKQLMTTEGFANFILEKARRFDEKIAAERFAEDQEESGNS